MLSITLYQKCNYYLRYCKLQHCQLISKANCQAMNSSKKRSMNSFLLVFDMFSFVFWKKLKTPKRYFEINWPLIRKGIQPSIKYQSRSFNWFVTAKNSFRSIILHKSWKFGWFTNCSEAISSIMSKVETAEDIYLEMQKKKCHLEIWKMFAIVKRFSHLQMNIFGLFNFCENRRNGFRFNILTLLLGTHVQAAVYYTYTLLQKYTQFFLFMMQNAYVPEGGNEGGRKATPTSTSIFDFYGLKALWYEFGNDIFTGCKMPRL